MLQGRWCAAARSAVPMQSPGCRAPFLRILPGREPRVDSSPVPVNQTGGGMMAWPKTVNWRRTLAGGCAAALLAGAALGVQAQDNPHRAIAMQIAGDEFAESAMKFCYRRQYTPPPSAVEYADSRVFDNLVFLGFGTNPSKWNAWALLTDEGIVLFDPLASDDEAERY